MNTIQIALAEVLEKYGRIDWHKTMFAKIALHRISEYNLVNAKTLLSLPYSKDDRDEIKYAVRRVDEIINLEVWK